MDRHNVCQSASSRLSDDFIYLACLSHRFERSLAAAIVQLAHDRETERIARTIPLSHGNETSRANFSATVEFRARPHRLYIDYRSRNGKSIWQPRNESVLDVELVSGRVSFRGPATAAGNQPRNQEMTVILGILATLPTRRTLPA